MSTLLPITTGTEKQNTYAESIRQEALETHIPFCFAAHQNGVITNAAGGFEGYKPGVKEQVEQQLPSLYPILNKANHRWWIDNQADLAWNAVRLVQELNAQ